jgi:hypothetical protein
MSYNAERPTWAAFETTRSQVQVLSPDSPNRRSQAPVEDVPVSPGVHEESAETDRTRIDERRASALRH